MPDSTPLSTMKVFHLPGAWGLPTVSPFCLKLDAWLRMTGIQHESRTVATPFAGPKSKAPWIQIDGTKLGDSTFIIAYLTERFGIDPDEELTAEQRGMAVAIQRLIDENLYWTMVHDRWVHEGNWRTFRDVVLGGLPLPQRRPEPPEHHGWSLPLRGSEPAQARAAPPRRRRPPSGIRRPSNAGPRPGAGPGRPAPGTSR